MSSKRSGLFLKVLTILFIGVVAMVMLGRNHFILGTALILFRWIFILFGFILFYFVYKRLTTAYKAGLVLAFSAILIEYAFDKAFEKRLTETAVVTEVSFMTYNIFFRNSSPDSSLARITESNPDILAVQELTPEWKSTLEKAMGDQYPYRKMVALKGTHGIAVYSRYLITNSFLLMDENNRPYAQVVELMIKNKKLQLINAHLASPAVAVENPDNFLTLYSQNYAIRKQQLESIQSLADSHQGNFDAQILLGDLNTTIYEPVYRELKRDWTNLFDVSGNGDGLNFPNSKNMDTWLTLDYIFGRGALWPTEIKVIKGGSSDHMAVAGKIKI